MANRGYLINTTALTSDPVELTRRREQPGHIDGEVASSANRLLIPWFCCFREADLRPVRRGSYTLPLPCTTLERAVRNLESSLDIFGALVREAELARAYWTLSCTLLQRLPLPYLTIDPCEVLLSSDPESDIAALVGALAGNESAVPHLQRLCGYDPAVVPYPVDVLYSIPGGEHDTARMFNASVLDGGFQPDFEYLVWNLGPDAKQPVGPPPVPAAVFGDIYDVPGELKRTVMSIDSAAAGAELALRRSSLERREQLEGKIYSRTAAAAKALKGNDALRFRLDALAQGQLEPWCRQHDFGWRGFSFESPDWARH